MKDEERPKITIFAPCVFALSTLVPLRGKMPLASQVGGQALFRLLVILEAEEGRMNDFVFVDQCRAGEVFSFETMVGPVPD